MNLKWNEIAEKEIKKKPFLCERTRINWMGVRLSSSPHLNSIVEQFFNKPKHLNKDEAMAWRAFDLNSFNRTPPIYQFVTNVLLIAAEQRKTLKSRNENYSFAEKKI